jgi:hypothetical protein
MDTLLLQRMLGFQRASRWTPRHSKPDASIANAADEHLAVVVDLDERAMAVGQSGLLISVLS